MLVVTRVVLSLQSGLLSVANPTGAAPDRPRRREIDRGRCPNLDPVKWLRFPRVLGVVVCLNLVGMSVVFGVLSRQNYQFVHTAAQTEGTVVVLVPRAPIGSTREPRANARRPSLAPTVRYVANGQTYTYTAAHGKFRQTLQPGDTVTVLYNPADPAVARLKG